MGLKYKIGYCQCCALGKVGKQSAKLVKEEGKEVINCRLRLFQYILEGGEDEERKEC